LDDLLNEANQNVCDLFTKLSHHRDVSVVFVIQNLFHRNRFVRTMNLNTHYLVLFKNPRDANQVSVLARQMYPGKSKFVVEAYRDATKNPFGYLLIDLRLETDESYRIRTTFSQTTTDSTLTFQKYKRGRVDRKIDRNESTASAADSAGIKTAESVDGDRQRDRGVYLKTCNGPFVDCLCECLRNLLKGRVPLKSKQLKDLRRYKRLLRKAALKNTPRSERRRILEKGGFIGAILPPLISGLGAVAA
jgi:hypothetical protein